MHGTMQLHKAASRNLARSCNAAAARQLLLSQRPSLTCWAAAPQAASATTNGTHRAATSPQSSALSSYHDDVESILFSTEELQARVRQMGAALAEEFQQKQPLVLGVLTGAFQFTGDLVRFMEPPPRGITVNFIRASSYGSGTSSSGEVKIKVDLDPAVIKGRHVILVEDIVDTGLTLTKLKKHLLEDCGAATCTLVALLDKRERRRVPLEADYVGFEIPNAFVVGYGLDFDEEYRTLPYIGVLRPECYAHKLS